METIAPLWLWATFVAIVLASLFIDFVVLRKQGAQEIGVKEALNWSLVWIALSFLFNGLFWWAVKDTTGSTELANTKSLEFLTGYLIEKSLAVDNIFVFLMIFTYFAVPSHFQKRVLMIGIIGAIVLRTIMILVGGWLLAEFHWILYVFGAFLILTGIKMWWAAGKEPDLDDNPALKLLRKMIPVSKDYDGENFWTLENGKKVGKIYYSLESILKLRGITLLSKMSTLKWKKYCDGVENNLIEDLKERESVHIVCNQIIDQAIISTPDCKYKKEY